MEEKETIIPVSPNVPLEEAKAALVKDASHEAFLGSLLVFALVILLLGVIGFFSFLGYRVYRQNQATRSIPSIDHLAIDKTIPLATATAPDTPSQSASTSLVVPATSTGTTEDKSSLQVKVLNGGATKGLAGTFAANLKKAGYTKVTVGNSFGDYTGTILYYAQGKSADAETLKADVAKTYPSVTTQEAPAGNKDATAAPYVIILGK